VRWKIRSLPRFSGGARRQALIHKIFVEGRQNLTSCAQRPIYPQCPASDECRVIATREETAPTKSDASSLRLIGCRLANTAKSSSFDIPAGLHARERAWSLRKLGAIAFAVTSRAPKSAAIDRVNPDYPCLARDGALPHHRTRELKA
jgi:hypothetical protein